MKKLLIITGVLLGSLFARSQTPADLVQDIPAHVTTLTGLKAFFSKQPFYKDRNDFYAGWNPAFLGHRVERAIFLNINIDTATPVLVEAIYKNEQIGYLKMVEERYDSTIKQYVFAVLYKYVDTAYTNPVLARYNRKHQTQFTWPDLYEDSCKGFAVTLWGSDYTDSAFDAKGNFTTLIGALYKPMKLEFYPLIKKRDHDAIIKNCLSFNPARKAYGAVCLYALQQL